jgi:hypothetical protein
MQLPSESESVLLHDWRFTSNQFVLATGLLRLTASNFFQLNICFRSPYVTSSLTRGLVCRLQLLLVLASVVILRYILLSQIRDSPNLEDQVSVFVSLRNRWPGYSPRHWVDSAALLFTVTDADIFLGRTNHLLSFVMAWTAGKTPHSRAPLLLRVYSL